MIVPGEILYEIIDRKTRHVFMCFPKQQLDLAKMFTAGVRSDEGFEIRASGKLIAEVTRDGTIRDCSTDDPQPAVSETPKAGVIRPEDLWPHIR